MYIQDISDTVALNICLIETLLVFHCMAVHVQGPKTDARRSSVGRHILVAIFSQYKFLSYSSSLLEAWKENWLEK